MHRVLVISIVAVAGVATGRGAVHAQSMAARVDSIFTAFTNTTPGCAVAVVDSGRTVFARGYGMASLEHNVPITPSTAFYAASVSKQFTAFAVALLAQQGKLSLDDDVRKWLPELPDFGKTITVRHLIHHTSGLRDYFGLLGMTGWPSDGPLTEAAFLDLVSRQKALNFDPGTRFLYSNTGYVLLSILVQRVSGKSLREFSNDAIFQPLGMTNTQFRDNHTTLIRNRALAYSPTADGGWRLNLPGFDVVGDGGLYTTVEDLAKWARNFDERTVGRDIADLVLTRGRLVTGDSIAYAFGLQHGMSNRVEPMITHGGSYGGYRTDFVRYPRHRVAAITLCNTTTAIAPQINNRVAAILLGDRLPAVTQPNPSAVPTGGAAASATGAQLAPYVGVYWDARAEVMRRLELRDTTSLVALGANRFRPANSNSTVEFVTAADGTLRMEETDPTGARTVFVRMPAPRTDAAALSDYSGEYYSPELDISWEMLVKDVALLLRRRTVAPVALQPVFLDAFQSPFGVLRFERAANGGVTGFVVGQGRVTGFRFERRRP